MAEGTGQEQVDIANALNEALKETSKLFDDIANSTQTTSEKLNEALKQLQEFNRESQNQSRTTEKVNRALETQRDVLGDTNDITKLMPKSIKDLVKATEKYGKSVIFLTAATSGLKNGLEATKATFNLFGGAMSSALSIAKGTIGLFSGIATGFFEAAADYYQQQTQAIVMAKENIREAFGDLQGPVGGMVVGFSKDLAGAQGALAAAGTSMYSVFGDTADRIAFGQQMAEGFGDSLVRLRDHVSANIGELALLSKGMGISGEAMKVMAIDAEKNGESMEEAINKTTVTSAYMAKSFGVDVKQIGKGFDQMMVDTKNFGDLAPEVMVATATYATKLGVSIQDLQGIMGKFDEFESAAQSAGMLAEAFGMNIDAMNMMMADNPAERVDMIRQAFEDTGRSVEDLNRRELQLMADQAGLDVDAMKNALSMSVDEMGFDDFEDAMNEAEEQMSVEESMATVAKSIARMHQLFADLADGPLGSLINGFIRGMEMSAEWREVMSTLSDYMVLFFNKGVELGRLFAEQFAALGATRANIEAFLNFEGVTTMFEQIKTALTTFFAALQVDPVAAGKDFIDKAWTAITDYIGTIGSSSMSASFGNVLENIINSVAGMAPVLIEKLSSMIQNISDFIGGNGVQSSIGAAAETGLGAAFSNAFNAVWTSMKEQLIPALLDLLGNVFDQIKGPLIGVLTAVWSVILLKSIATALAQQAIVSLVTGGMGKIFGAASTGTAATQAAGAMGGGNPASAANAGATLTSLVTSTTALTMPQIVDFSLKLGVMAASMLPAMAAYAAGAALIAKAYQAMGVELGDILTAFTGIGLSLAATGGLLYLQKAIPVGGLGGLMKTLGVAAALNVALAAYAWGLANFVMPLAGALDLKRVLVFYASIGTSLLATAGIALLGSAMATTLAGALLGLGAAIGAAFVALPIMWAYGNLLALTVTNTKLPELEAMMKFYGAIGASLLGTAGVILAGVPLIPLAAIGVVVAAAMAVTLGLLEFAIIPFVSYVTTSFMDLKIDEKKVTSRVETIQMVVLGLADLMGLSTLMAPFAIAAPILKVGINTMMDFASYSVPKIGEIISSIDAIKISDPRTFMMKIRAVGKIIESIQGLGQMGLEAGKLAGIGSLFGRNSSAETAVTTMSGFITSIMDSATSMVKGMITIAKGIDPATLKSLSVIGDILTSISSFAGSMMSPLQKIQENSGFFGNLLGDPVKDVTNGMVEIMDALKDNLKPMVDGMVTAISGIVFPKGIKEKIGVLDQVFGAVGKVVKVVTDLHALGEDNTGWFEETSTADVVKEMFGSVTKMFEGDTLPNMINTVGTSLSSFTGLTEAQVANLDSLDSMIKAVEKLSKFGTFMTDKGLDGLKDLDYAWSVMDFNNLHVSDFVTDIKTEVDAVAKNLKNMEIELDNINLKPIVGGILKASGKNEITIKPGNVHMHVKFNVSMDAKELAMTMASAGEKEYEGGYFVLSEGARKDTDFMEGLGE